MSDQNQMPGAASTYSSDISEEARKTFDTALSGVLGKVYEPVAVSAQLVAGMNYKFFCNAKVVGPDDYNSAAIVSVYQPLPGQGDAVVKSIVTI